MEVADAMPKIVRHEANDEHIVFAKPEVRTSPSF
jgi:hypothetical protein